MRICPTPHTTVHPMQATHVVIIDDPTGVDVPYEDRGYYCDSNAQALALHNWLLRNRIGCTIMSAKGFDMLVNIVNKGG